MSKHNGRRPAVFLDRDGVINENRADYVKSWDELKLLPGALDALRALAASPFAVVVVSNQAAVNRGLLSRQILEDMHQRLQTLVTAAGGQLDAIYYCPHRPDETCACRKPQPGMLLEAAGSLHLALERSYLVGDAITDLEAAVAVGVQPLLVLTGRGSEHAVLLDQQSHVACPVVDDLRAAVAWISARERLNLGLALE